MTRRPISPEPSVYHTTVAALIALLLMLSLPLAVTRASDTLSPLVDTGGSGSSSSPAVDHLSQNERSVTLIESKQVENPPALATLSQDQRMIELIEGMMPPVFVAPTQNEQSIALIEGKMPAAVAVSDGDMAQVCCYH